MYAWEARFKSLKIMEKLGGTNDAMNALSIVVLQLEKKNGAYISFWWNIFFIKSGNLSFKEPLHGDKE